jgi:polyisoprenoid-binding protein YceI
MKWNLDTTHSAVDFSVKHLMIATVKGRFGTFTGNGETNDDGTIKSVAIDIDATSINTNQAQRDAHLRSPDFFDVEKFPNLTFASSKIVQDGTDVTITGDLVMHGITKAVTLKGEVTPVIKDPWGNQRIALNVEGKLNRKDWGLGWNMALEAGGVTVSEEVKLSIEVQATAVTAAAAVAA